MIGVNEKSWCVFCGGKLENDLDLDTGVCQACADATWESMTPAERKEARGAVDILLEKTREKARLQGSGRP